MAKKKAPDAPWAVARADAREYLAALAGRADLVVADPPYNMGVAYDASRDDLTDQEYVTFTRGWLGAAQVALAPHGSLWVFAPDEWAADTDVICRRELKLHRRSWVVWYFTFGVASQKNFSRSHVHLLYYTRTKTKFHFDPQAVRVPSARAAQYNDKRARPGGKQPDNTWMLLADQLQAAAKPDHDVWLESRVCGTFKERKKHAPNQIPEAVVRRIVLATSKPGDLVVDPFTGSGTTGAVAVGLGRRFRGCDLSEAAVRAAQLRIEKGQLSG